MLNRSFFILISVIIFTACAPGRIAPKEVALLPGAGEGKWWIINTVLQDRHGKDVHFNSLVSVDKEAGTEFAACFVSIYTNTGNGYYRGIRNTGSPGISAADKLPMRIRLPAKDSLGMEWSLLLRRNSLNMLTDLGNKGLQSNKGYTEFSASFEKKDPFSISGISDLPKAWALDPLSADVKLSGDMQASAKSKLLIRVFSNKDILLKRSSAAYMHWVDLSLSSGKFLSILFSTDPAGAVKTDAVLLWDEEGKIMAKPRLAMKKKTTESHTPGSTRQYPLYFSIELPEQQLDLVLQPTIREQEMDGNKHAFWMGAVQLVDKGTGAQAGKGNMYVFKQ